MPLGILPLLLVPVVATIAVVVARRHGAVRGVVVGVILLSGLGAWYWLGQTDPPSLPLSAAEGTPDAFVTSVTCAECHAEQYESWHRTYHRTMTRDPTPEFVKGDFANATHDYRGIRSRFTREGDAYFVETVDPNWAMSFARTGGKPGTPPRHAKFRVDRLVGSHWIQEYLTRSPDGQYIRLPLMYHIRERQWVQSNGAFLAPDTPDFWAQSRGSVWNDTCLYCHNTGPSKNPVRGGNGLIVGFETETAELGIACGACHGPGADHVREHRNQPRVPGAERDLVNPSRLSVSRRDEICARCHGAIVPKESVWDQKTHRDPFVPGHDLTRYNQFFHSEAEQRLLLGARSREGERLPPAPNDGRFWGDGTPLTTALEYNGMALSACYQNGRGQMSCLSCHTMHGDDPNLMLKPQMQTNQVCYQCHSEYLGKLAEHTRHAVDSEGSSCVSCHMPHQVYSLMATHRSHRIQVPDLAGSVGTGKPHACNQCHLDKSLGWTREQLARWPNGKRNAEVKLSPDEETISAAVLTLSRGDARSRVVVAGMFVNPAARRASGVDWYGPFLTRLLEHERYPMVRYFAYRALQTDPAGAVGPYDYLATPEVRQKQLLALRSHFDATPIRRERQYLPLTPTGSPDGAVLDRLRAARRDPDLCINE